MIDVLARPIEELIATVGTGEFPVEAPPEALRLASSGLALVGDIAARAVGILGESWSGSAALAATEKIEDAVAAGTSLSRHGDELGALLAHASESVQRGYAELTAVLESFLGWAAAALPTLAAPAGQAALLSVAAEHLHRALVVAARVRAEMDAHTAQAHALAVPPSVPPPAAIAPTSGPDPVARTVGTVFQAMTRPASVTDTGATTTGWPPAFPHTSSSDWSGYTGATTDGVAADGAAPGHRAYDPRTGGTGVEVTLPDGSTAIAPNDKAAAAVRTALDLQGTPYVWGGTDPSTGLDCSGFTQYAYGQAGVDLPRLAQEQDVGTPVDAENLLPGDLAVWDGHVAMVVGNGQLVEAGDPVSVGPIRTSNAGMGFQGFFRPTA